MTKRKTKTQLIKEADKVFSQVIRKRAGQCEYCGNKETLQCAHVIPRTHKYLRWNLDNAVCLCYKHHIFWSHKNPLEFAKWFQDNYPVRYLLLMREKNKVVTDLGQSMEFIVNNLKEKLKEL